jgi:hypothetical protein
MNSSASKGNGGVSREQIEKVLPYLSEHSAHPKDYVEYRIGLVFRAVRNAKKAKVFTNASLRKNHQKLFHALGEIENAKANAGDFLYVPLMGVSIEEVQRDRKLLEELDNVLSAPRKKAGGKKNLGREAAVQGAYDLLSDFGALPTRTREKAWHLLANILYDEPNTDLFQTLLEFRRFTNNNLEEGY